MRIWLESDAVALAVLVLGSAIALTVFWSIRNRVSARDAQTVHRIQTLRNFPYGRYLNFQAWTRPLRMA